MARRDVLLRRRILMVGTFGLLGICGCALIAGVDFEKARLIDPRTINDSAVFGEGGTPTVNGDCPPDKKVCNGACFPKGDPAYGCGGECAPCSLAHAAQSRCGVAGQCIPQTCEPSFDNCDQDPANGCETDLTRPETCGACGNKCATGMLCAPTVGCVVACPPGLKACAGSCVNVSTSSLHCGDCDKACPTGAPNADPACLAGTCGIACRAGFADCANTPPQTCAPLPKWYVDTDNDDYGTATFTGACTRPAGHAPNSGDCLDSNPAVHPGAVASDVGFAGANGLSFDYDCSGMETEENAPVHWNGTCPGCSGNGFVPLTPPRVGPGVNNYCGSPTQHVCFIIPPSGGCNSVDYDAGVRIMCK